jgi:hypothetical protein
MPSATTPTVSEATPAQRRTIRRFGSVLPAPAEERKKPAGNRIAAIQIPVRARKSSMPSIAAASARSCASERALERGRRLPTANQAQHEEPSVLDRD